VSAGRSLSFATKVYFGRRMIIHSALPAASAVVVGNQWDSSECGLNRQHLADEAVMPYLSRWGL
jgi:hypothetical protein